MVDKFELLAGGVEVNLVNHIGQIRHFAEDWLIWLTVFEI